MNPDRMLKITLRNDLKKNSVRPVSWSEPPRFFLARQWFFILIQKNNFKAGPRHRWKFFNGLLYQVQQFKQKVSIFPPTPIFLLDNFPQLYFTDKRIEMNSYPVQVANYLGTGVGTGCQSLRYYLPFTIRLNRSN